MSDRAGHWLFGLGIGALAAIFLLLAWLSSKSYVIVLAVLAAFLVVILGVFALRTFRRRVETLTGESEIAARLRELRVGAETVEAIWSGEYDPHEVRAYFDEESADLERSDVLHVTRIINPAVIPEEQLDALAAMRVKFGDRFVLYEDASIRSFELFVATYPRPGKDPVAVVIVNNTLTKRPQVAVILDPRRDSRFAGAVDAVQRWFSEVKGPLTRFDPADMDRWRRIAAGGKYTKFVTENSKGIEFLDRYPREERELFRAHIQRRLSEGPTVSVVEVGCGDGRALLSYAPADTAHSLGYLIGFDYAPEMIEAAQAELRHRQRMGDAAVPGAHVINEKARFYLLNVYSMRRYFDDGRLREPESLAQAAMNGDAAEIDATRFARSVRIFGCMLNTIGVIESVPARAKFLENILAALGEGDSLVLSVFSRGEFARTARTLYGKDGLEEMIGVGVRDEHFDDATATFHIPTKPGYYSHWFDEDELVDLLNLAAAELRREGRVFSRPVITVMDSGGYFVELRRDQ